MEATKRIITEGIDLFFHDLSVSELKIQQGIGEADKLTQNDLCYLNIIAAKRNTYTVSKLSELIGISKPSVTNKINDLERRGLVVKNQDEKDKRVHYIDVRPSEHNYFEYCVLQEEIAEEIMAQHSKEEIAAFVKILGYVGEAYLEKTSSLNNRLSPSHAK